MKYKIGTFLNHLSYSIDKTEPRYIVVNHIHNQHQDYYYSNQEYLIYDLHYNNFHQLSEVFIEKEMIEFSL